MSKVIGIVGSRRRDSDEDYLILLDAFLQVYEPGDSIVSGGCKEGGDRMAEAIAKDRGITITIHYPRKEDLDQKLLKTNPRAAYAIINHARNTTIAVDCGILLALVAPDRKGGTEDTVVKAHRLGKDVILI